MVYAGVYLTLQYTPLQHATNLVALEREHQAMGRRYARNAAGDMNHLVCMGFTDPDAVVDDRPVVIFEAMEGLGQALAVAGVLEKVARVGIACAYDRAGFGWSDPFASDQRRGPDNIATVPGRLSLPTVRLFFFFSVGGLARAACSCVCLRVSDEVPRT